MVALPGDGAPDSLVNVYALGIAQFLADAARIDHDVLFGVDAPAQRFGQTTMWDARDTALPPRSFSNFLYPLGHAERKWFANIVDATCGALICHGQHNSAGNVF